MNKSKILVVEDDPNLGQILTEYLRLKNFDSVLCSDGEAGLKCYKSQTFDLCLLDIMMPRMDGFTLAREIRLLNNQIPIIFLTAKTLKEDTIEGFRAGGDDYITKPFSMEELVWRINAVLRRAKQANDEEVKIYQLGNFSFDTVSQQLIYGDDIMKLTTKESHLLKLLCENKNRVLSRKSALKIIWGDDSYFNARSMDVYVTKLRKYLRKDKNLNIITIHGEGLKLIDILNQ